MKKIISIIITISMLLVSVPAFAFSGTGTEANPYLISSASDIAKIHDDLDGYYKLTNNINMSGVAFEPIGNENEGAFTGTIDGAGYTISNLNINLPDNKYVGFVGYLEGTIKNLNLTNVDAYGYRYVGGLVGYAETDSEINDCSVSGKVSGQYQILNLNIGGIVGYSNTNIYGCVSMTDIDVPQYSNNIGGVVGYCNGDISNCSSKGNILCNNSEYIGGITGYCSGSITDSYNLGEVTYSNSSQYIGGVSGFCGSVINCFNSGNVTKLNRDGVGGKFCGGVSGYVKDDAINVNNFGCVYSYVASDRFDNYCGGIVGYSNGSIKNSINRGIIELDFDGYHYSGYLGGISGSSQTVEYCNNYGSIFASGYENRTGGISAKSSVSFCCNYANVKGGRGLQAGGLASSRNSYAGGVTCYGNVNNSINYGEISMQNNYHTICRTISYSGYVSSVLDYSYGPMGNTIKNSVKLNNNIINFYNSSGDVVTKTGSAMFYEPKEFEDFDFEEVWSIESELNSGFPILKNMPKHLKLNESAIVLQRNNTSEIRAYIDNVNENVTWTSTDPTIATVSTDGVVTAKSLGSCTITATNAEGMKADCLVYVCEKATSLELSDFKISISLGQAHTLTDIQTPNSANETVKWYSEDETIAIVDKYGRITAKTKGTTKVCAITSQSELRAECTVNVLAPITSISLSVTSKTINVGSSDVLIATLSPVIYDGNIIWSSSDESIASVDQSGKITAHKNGTAYITATATSGVTAQCKVTVTQPSTSVAINKPRITTYVNSTYQLSASMLPLDTTDTITWSSSSTTYATVSSTGLVTGKRVGTATITARTSSGLTATCYVTVKSTPIEPTSITLSDTYITLAPEDAKALTATLLPSNATETTLTWTSSNDDVATVDRNGVITAVGEGFATIKAKTANGLSHECVVKVVSASGPSIIVDNVKSFPAGIAKTKVNIIRNPGISGYKFTISYDDALLTPVSVTANKEFGGTLTTNLEDENRSGLNIVWRSDKDVDLNGELFTVAFKVSESAEYGNSTSVSVDYGAKDIFNTSGDCFALYVDDAVVSIEEPSPGDIYEDGEITAYDLTLLAKYITSIENFDERQIEAADVNNDGLVNILDVILLGQYLVGWSGVELMSLETDVPVIEVGSAEVNPAGEAEIPVCIKNNTGILGYRFVLDYNEDEVEILSITPTDLIDKSAFNTNLGLSSVKENGVVVSCFTTGADITDDGVLFNVRVRYKKSVGTKGSVLSIKESRENMGDQKATYVEAQYTEGFISNVVYGDADGDGNVTVFDAVRVLKSIAGITTLTSKQLELADVNCDGFITVTDATQILKYIARIINSF